MDELEFRELLEAELTWRMEELVFLKNILTTVNGEDKKEKYRKSLICMLYSHFEGFVKISLQTYAQFITKQNLSRKHCNENLISTSMFAEFEAYDNFAKKSTIFKRKLPDDSRIHKLCRRTEFVANIPNYLELPLLIKDNCIDTQSNLHYIVLIKNLYQLGLPLDLFEKFELDINKLVHKRNSIAHGNEKSGVKEEEYQIYEKAIYYIMSSIIRVLYDYASNKQFLVEPPVSKIS